MIQPIMKLEIFSFAAALLVLPLHADPQRQERKSLLESDPDVIYLDQTLKKPLELKVIKEAPVFFYKDGSHRIGSLKPDQMLKLEAITEKSYRIRGDDVSGWVAPWAFSSPDPDLVANLKLYYNRQIAVRKLIADKRVAVGMTLEEISQSRGKPTKTTVRKTATGESGSWEFIEYEDVKNYATEIDRSTGQVFRRLVSITRVEKGKTAVEFENNLVTAIEESQDHQGGNVKIIIPPLVFGW